MTRSQLGAPSLGKGVFVIGTDTECGKTEISLGFMRLLESAGHRVLAMKPVASGSDRTPDGLRNTDAVRLMRESSRLMPYDAVNPYAFETPVAPHIAAAAAGTLIDLDLIRDCYRELASRADYTIVEGVGGWRVPLGADREIPDLVRTLGLPVILVVGVRLGCINHSLLTVESMASRGVELLGWVANLRDPDMLEIDANLEALEARIPGPCLGRVPILNPVTPRAVARWLEWPETVSGR